MGTTATLALIAASTAFGVAQSIASGNAQAKAASHRGAALRQQAETQRALAKAEEQKLRRRQARQLSAQSALLAARGFDPSAGSPLLLQEQGAAESEFDALLARAGGLARVNDLEVDAQQASFSAGVARSRGLLNAGSTLLSGAQTFSSVYDHKKQPKDRDKKGPSGN